MAKVKFTKEEEAKMNQERKSARDAMAKEVVAEFVFAREAVESLFPASLSFEEKQEAVFLAHEEIFAVEEAEQEEVVSDLKACISYYYEIFGKNARLMPQAFFSLYNEAYCEPEDEEE